MRQELCDDSDSDGRKHLGGSPRKKKKKSECKSKRWEGSNEIRSDLCLPAFAAGQRRRESPQVCWSAVLGLWFKRRGWKGLAVWCRSRTGVRSVATTSLATADILPMAAIRRSSQPAKTSLEVYFEIGVVYEDPGTQRTAVNVSVEPGATFNGITNSTAVFIKDHWTEVTPDRPDKLPSAEQAAESVETARRSSDSHSIVVAAPSRLLLVTVTPTYASSPRPCGLRVLRTLEWATFSAAMAGISQLQSGGRIKPLVKQTEIARDRHRRSWLPTHCGSRHYVRINAYNKSLPSLSIWCATSDSNGATHSTKSTPASTPAFDSAGVMAPQTKPRLTDASMFGVVLSTRVTRACLSTLCSCPTRPRSPSARADADAESSVSCSMGTKPSRRKFRGIREVEVTAKAGALVRLEATRNVVAGLLVSDFASKRLLRHRETGTPKRSILSSTPSSAPPTEW
ncbi:hypothetical protein EDB86DRAFT_2829389 [Lactarius hatsudake]|nr:hypothetical protein EDB86DRAFT_2829389 [Lactarius hatsudake]